MNKQAHKETEVDGGKPSELDAPSLAELRIHSGHIDVDVTTPWATHADATKWQQTAQTQNDLD